MCIDICYDKSSTQMFIEIWQWQWWWWYGYRWVNISWMYTTSDGCICMNKYRIKNDVGIIWLVEIVIRLIRWYMEVCNWLVKM